MKAYKMFSCKNNLIKTETFTIMIVSFYAQTTKMVSKSSDLHIYIPLAQILLINTSRVQRIHNISKSTFSELRMNR